MSGSGAPRRGRFGLVSRAEGRMSFLVELPLELYDGEAFAAFRPGADFDLGTARALMWMSQLAYETAHPDKINTIGQRWGLARTRVLAGAEGALSLTRTRAVVAEGHGATILAFAGTDPLVPANWFTDLDFTVTPGAIHRGFEGAAAAIWEPVLQALAGRREQPVFLTGHSLGAALAAVTAERALADANVRASAVYAFGMPRTGDGDFAARYNETLGAATYRLVHGDDIVATAPPSALGFRHVGRLLACPRAGKFAPGAQPAPEFTDDPPFARSLASGLQQGFMDLFAGRLQPSFRNDQLGRMSGLLPPPIADHLPDRYLHALEAT
jgi:triacylglycerol lipase